MLLQKKNLIIVVLAILITGLLITGGVQAAETNNSSKPSLSSAHSSQNKKDNRIKYAPHEIIVKFKPTVKSQLSISVTPEAVVETNIHSIDRLNRKFKVKALSKVFKGKKPKTIRRVMVNVPDEELPDLSTVYRAKLPDDVDIFQAISEYRQDPSVEYAEPNYLATIFSTYPNDTFFPAQWSLHNTGESGGTNDADIDAPEAWDTTTGSSDVVVVAIIDTGVFLEHSDLGENIWQNTGETPGNGTDDDNNGFVDDVNGWDFYNDDNNPVDDNEHGTHVAGISSAVTDNGTGIAGVSWNSKIMAVKVLGSGGSGPYSGVANGIVYAADNGADVINLSLGGAFSSCTLREAIDYAYAHNCVIVASSGNTGDSTINYPAGDDKVIAVAATDYDDVRANFSTYGQVIDVAAPGVSIYSTVLNNGYNTFDGTSMAAPHVSGIVALILSNNPQVTNTYIRKLLYICAEDIGSEGWDKYTGFGRVNAFRALTSDSVDYLLARIRRPKEGNIFSKNITITGTAAGNSFDRYEVFVGRGENPTIWETTGLTLAGGQVVDGVLATWDCSSYENDTWTIKLISHDLCGITTETTSYVIIDNSLQQGWPQETMYGGASYNASIVTGDVDNDGVLEVVTGSYEGNIYIWRYDGTPLEGWPVYIGGQSLTPALADLDGDGDLEIAIGTNSSYQNEKLFVLHHNGDPFEGNWPKGWGSEYGSEINYISDAPTIADIDGDGDLEILVANELREICAWHHDGTIVSGWPADLFKSQNGTGVSIGDIDGDGDMEILAAESSVSGVEVYGNVYAWHHDGSTVAGWPIDVDGTLYQPVLGDVNGDGKSEVIVGSRAGLFVFNAEGALVFVKYIGINECKLPCLGDLDNDGIPEIILLGGNNTIYAWHGDGSYVSGWPRTFGFYNDALVSGAVVGDVDDDGEKEIVAAVYDSYYGRSYLYAFNPDGTFVNGYPKETDIDYCSIPVLTDLDKDGDVEIVAHGRYTGKLGVRVYAWDLPGLYDEDRMDWPMIGRNARHTASYLVAPPSVSILEPADGSTVSGTIVIKSSACDDVGVSKVEYQIDGSEPWTDMNKNNGTYSADWDTTTVANGDHVITVRATDTSGNSSTNEVSVTVNNVGDTTLPTVSISEPTNSSTVSDTVTIKATASDDVAVEKVEYQIDGADPWTNMKEGKGKNKGTYSANWDTTIVSDGLHTLTVRATDTSNNASTDQISVTVANGFQEPGVMHVEHIDMSIKTAGPNINAIAVVTVLDANGVQVEGATVSGHWSGLTEDTDSGITDADGLVALSTYSPYTFDKGNSFTIFVISLPTYHSSALSEKSALDSYSILSPMFYEFH
ncbi:MAG: S8 family serine peptidase [Deltaproteobacteria bacterium]|jgi:hypothetical protein|nr:S8 family serine peptidase [Deltaproteobacteria bacterium]